MNRSSQIPMACWLTHSSIHRRSVVLLRSSSSPVVRTATPAPTRTGPGVRGWVGTGACRCRRASFAERTASRPAQAAAAAGPLVSKGGATPSCRATPSASSSSQASAIFPPASRTMRVWPNRTRTPVGGRPRYGPAWVPKVSSRRATRSATPNRSTTSAVRSGYAVSRPWRYRRYPAIPRTVSPLRCGGACSQKSGRRISSSTS